MLSRVSTYILGLTLIVSASAVLASDPLISSLAPAHGPTSGKTVVRVTGANLVAPIQCLVPCPAEVYFGAARAELISEASDVLVVRTPAHLPGVVDVRVKRNDGREVIAHAGFRYGAEDSSNFRFLLPIIAQDTPGSGGSSWKTDLWVRNRSAEDVALAPAICPDGGACPAVFPLTVTVPAKQSIQNPLIQRKEAPTPGVILYAMNSRGESLEWQLRLADQSRTSTDAGTELPVLSESEFLHESTSLLNVPMSSSFRQTLRIYDLTESGNSSFRLRFYRQSEGTELLLLSDTVRTLSTTTGPFKSEPGYVQILRLADAYPLLRTVDRVRVEIEPLDPNADFWAFVSITNHATQTVTTVTP